MVEAGLDEELIVAKIRSSKTNFDLSTQALITLNKKGVSKRIIRVMMDPSAPDLQPQPAPSVQPTTTTAAPADPVAKKETELMADGKPLPKNPGVYWFDEAEGFAKLDQRTLAQAKVGGRLGHWVTLGVKSVKNKAYLLGHAAKMRIRHNQPIFYIHVPEGMTVDEFVIVEMDQKPDRRELEVASVGGIVGAKQGLRFEKIRPTESEEVAERVFKVVTRSPLAKGEYFFYMIGSADAIKGIMGKGYDFAIE